jgi:hypothetical protein
MLIIALVLAVIGLAALVTAVVTSNELIAWVCIGASVIGVLLLIVDALRERSRDSRDDESEEPDGPVGTVGSDDAKAETPASETPASETMAFVQPEPAEDYPEEQEPEVADDADTTDDTKAVESDEYDDETSRSKAD